MKADLVDSLVKLALALAILLGPSIVKAMRKKGTGNIPQDDGDIDDEPVAGSESENPPQDEVPKWWGEPSEEAILSETRNDGVGPEAQPDAITSFGLKPPPVCSDGYCPETTANLSGMPQMTVGFDRLDSELDEFAGQLEDIRVDLREAQLQQQQVVVPQAAQLSSDPLQRAILIREILGPPASMRSRRRSGRAPVAEPMRK